MEGTVIWDSLEGRPALAGAGAGAGAGVVTALTGLGVATGAAAGVGLGSGAAAALVTAGTGLAGDATGARFDGTALADEPPPDVAAGLAGLADFPCSASLALFAPLAVGPLASPAP